MVSRSAKAVDRRRASVLLVLGRDPARERPGSRGRHHRAAGRASRRRSRTVASSGRPRGRRPAPASRRSPIEIERLDGLGADVSGRSKRSAAPHAPPRRRARRATAIAARTRSRCRRDAPVGGPRAGRPPSGRGPAPESRVEHAGRSVVCATRHGASIGPGQDHVADAPEPVRAHERSRGRRPGRERRPTEEQRRARGSTVGRPASAGRRRPPDHGRRREALEERVDIAARVRRCRARPCRRRGPRAPDRSWRPRVDRRRHVVDRGAPGPAGPRRASMASPSGARPASTSARAPMRGSAGRSADGRAWRPTFARRREQTARGSPATVARGIVEGRRPTPRSTSAHRAPGEQSPTAITRAAGSGAPSAATGPRGRPARRRGRPAPGRPPGPVRRDRAGAHRAGCRHSRRRMRDHDERAGDEPSRGRARRPALGASRRVAGSRRTPDRIDPDLPGHAVVEGQRLRPPVDAGTTL